MGRFAAVPLPESLTGDVGAARAAIEGWATSEPIAALVDAFGGTVPGGDAEETLASLDAFSEAHWDFRKGAERNLAMRKDFDPETDLLVHDAARALGLIDPLPPRHDAYDHVLILGGLVRACLVRPQHARALLDNGLSAGEVTALGAFRPLRGDEFELAEQAGLGDVANEIEAMEAGVRRAFGLGEPAATDGVDDAENPNRSWRVSTYAADHTPVTLVAAPTRDPARRANTPDTYAYWATEIARLAQRPGQRVLLVTSAIYVPFQHAHAIRMLNLPYGAHVDTVGVDTSLIPDPSLSQRFTAANYLQEIRSTVRAMRGLLAALNEHAA